MRSARKWVLVLLVIPLLLAGCWDRREIEEIGMVVGMAIDKGAKKDELILTAQFVNTITAGKDVGTVHTYYNITTTGKNLMDTIREMSSKTDRTPYFTHLKVILISDAVARDTDMQDLINLLMRDHEIRRTVQVLIAKGQASKLLEEPTRKKELPSLEIWGMTGNDYKTIRIPSVVTIGDISIHLIGRTSFVIQQIEEQKDGLRLSGGAVIDGKRRRLAGFVEQIDELAGMAWLRVNEKGRRGGVIYVTDDQNRKVVYDVRRVERKISIRSDGSPDRVVIVPTIRLEGKLAEDWSYPGNAFHQSYLRELEKRIEREVMNQTKAVLKRLQKELKQDVLGYEDQYRVQEYASWKKVRNRWDEVFSKARIEPQVKVYIRDYGSQGKKKADGASSP